MLFFLSIRQHGAAFCWRRGNRRINDRSSVASAILTLCLFLIPVIGGGCDRSDKKVAKDPPTRATQPLREGESSPVNDKLRAESSTPKEIDPDSELAQPLEDGSTQSKRQTASPSGGPRVSIETDSSASRTDSPPSRIDSTPRSNSNSGNAVAYRPGITLNYEALQVEVDATVILRQGELELLLWADSPTPKAHETILVTKAKPSAIFEALGLMGLTPGSPPWFDYEEAVAHAAKGDAVDVFVRYQSNGQLIEHNICDWVTNKSKQQPMQQRNWVFCGSRREDDGRFAADFEGTVITVVDFPSSLLSLAESHSESNAELWLVANAERIPAIDTPVTVILRAVKNADGD